MNKPYRHLHLLKQALHTSHTTMCSTGVLLVRSFVVLLCLAAVEIHLTPAKVLATGTGDGLLRVPTNAFLASCPSHCGDVEISYPFGIGPRCFRQGFELTCDNTTGSPRLLFLGNSSTQVTSINVGSNYVYASAVGYNITMGLGEDTYITKSWEAPAEGVIQRGNSLFVVGCGVVVYIFGDNVTDLIGSCMSICTDNREIMEGANVDVRYCGGIGCCSIWWSSGRGSQAFTFKLGRHNTRIPQLDEDLSNVKVIFTENYDFVTGDLYASWVNTSNVYDMALEIAITDQPSCTSAQSQVNKDTYACNSESICRDLGLSPGGYNCFCPSQTDGNPYVADGCIQDYNPKAPKENCTRLCGNMIIPFPFGIEEGCFANDNLQLNCTSSGTTILDREYAQYRVTNLSLDDGLLMVTNMLNDASSNNMERVVIITNYDGHQNSFYEEAVDDNFDFSQEDIIMKWVIANLTCQEARLNSATYACISDNSFCEDVMRGKARDGYRCRCSHGFQGNPYLQNNCTDIDECSIPNKCDGICHNFDGGFNCTRCSHGKEYDTNKHKCVMSAKQRNLIHGLNIGVGIGGGTTLLLLALCGPFVMHKIRRLKMKKMFFKQNHGLLLQQLISQNANISERMIITLRELELATNNFNRDCVVGGGGHGIVFKGNLDLRVVAIKKSKIVVQREIDEFINEVVILSQVNHRNVVKFLGCCLETEVPLLVYEFISNGTLYHHLHVEGPISISWGDRLRIALEVARALSYLHSAASMPIFHRDIKSSNILLDDSLTAKVSDFGASRYIPIDQIGVTTVVQGTIGYLDPMYYITGRLTDKSDVFSFGVLLIELLTRKKPFVHMPEYCGGLVSHFTTLLTEGNFIDIMDHQAMEEENGEVQEVAALAVLCTKMEGEDRPTMRHVEMTLENLLAKRKHVPYHTTRRRCDDDGTVAHYMCIEQAQEASRQYTMEEEIMLSSRYPR